MSSTAGSAGNGAGDAHALLLAAGKLVREFPREDRWVEVEKPEQFLHATADARLVPAEELWNGCDIFRDRSMREKPCTLDGVAHAEAELLRIDARGVDAVDENAAGTGLDEAVDHLQGRRLAAARRADERHNLPFAHLEVEALHDGSFAVDLGQALGHDHARVSSISVTASRTMAEASARPRIGTAPSRTRSMAV